MLLEIAFARQHSAACESEQFAVFERHADIRAIEFFLNDNFIVFIARPLGADALLAFVDAHISRAATRREPMR